MPAVHPAGGASVRFNLLNNIHLDDTSRCRPDLGWNCTLAADANGVAILPSMSGGSVGTGTFTVFASLGGVDLGVSNSGFSSTRRRALPRCPPSPVTGNAP
jgi:hypothetical protein